MPDVTPGPRDDNAAGTNNDGDTTPPQQKGGVPAELIDGISLPVVQDSRLGELADPAGALTPEEAAALGRPEVGAMTKAQREKTAFKPTGTRRKAARSGAGRHRRDAVALGNEIVRRGGSEQEADQAAQEVLEDAEDAPRTRTYFNAVKKRCREWARKTPKKRAEDAYETVKQGSPRTVRELDMEHKLTFVSWRPPTYKLNFWAECVAVARHRIVASTLILLWPKVLHRARAMHLLIVQKRAMSITDAQQSLGSRELFWGLMAPERDRALVRGQLTGARLGLDRRSFTESMFGRSDPDGGRTGTAPLLNAIDLAEITRQLCRMAARTAPRRNELMQAATGAKEWVASRYVQFDMFWLDAPVAHFSGLTELLDDILDRGLLTQPWVYTDASGNVKRGGRGWPVLVATDLLDGTPLGVMWRPGVKDERQLLAPLLMAMHEGCEGPVPFRYCVFDGLYRTNGVAELCESRFGLHVICTSLAPLAQEPVSGDTRERKRIRQLLHNQTPMTPDCPRHGCSMRYKQLGDDRWDPEVRKNHGLKPGENARDAGLKAWKILYVCPEADCEKRAWVGYDEDPSRVRALPWDKVTVAGARHHRLMRMRGGQESAISRLMENGAGMKGKGRATWGSSAESVLHLVGLKILVCAARLAVHVDGSYEEAEKQLAAVVKRDDRQRRLELGPGVLEAMQAKLEADVIRAQMDAEAEQRPVPQWKRRQFERRLAELDRGRRKLVADAAEEDQARLRENDGHDDELDEFDDFDLE